MTWEKVLELITTRTTRTPAFWGYPPPPHDYPYYNQFILNPKSILLTSSYRIPSQNKVKAEKFEKLAKTLDFGILLQTQHATHPLMVVIICGKYGNNRSRTENVTERTRFSKSRSNDLEDIGQGQRSSHATHLLMLEIICTKYGKNLSRL